MRHGKAFRKLNRTASHRRAMLRNMVTSLIEHEQITTTDAKAKELRKVFERMVTLAKDGSLHARRQALSYVRSKQMVHKLFSELAQRYASRNGGYVQIVKLGPRRGDGAMMSVVSLVTGEVAKPSRRARKKKAAKTAGKPAKAAAPKKAAAEKPEAEKPAKKKAEPKAAKEPAAEEKAEAVAEAEEKKPAKKKTAAKKKAEAKDEAPAEKPAEDKAEAKAEPAGEEAEDKE